jgi:ribonuclease Z
MTSSPKSQPNSEAAPGAAFTTHLESGIKLALASDLSIQGLSLSGIRTALVIPELAIGFDVAQGLPFSMNAKKYFITHAHLDHAAGIPYIISQKSMHHAPTPEFYLPEAAIEPLREIMRLWAKLEGHVYRFEFLPTTPESEIDLNPKYAVRPFPTVHRVPSFGYSLILRNKKLKSEFSHLKGPEIQKLKNQGTVVDELIETPMLSFTGDTQIDFLDRSEAAAKSKYLFMECTYLDSKKSVEHARTWGHTHLDELLPRLKDIQSEKIYLIHSSSRYSTREALEILRQRLPSSEQDRVSLFLGR